MQCVDGDDGRLGSRHGGQLVMVLVAVIIVDMMVRKGCVVVMVIMVVDKVVMVAIMIVDIMVRMDVVMMRL